MGNTCCVSIHEALYNHNYQARAPGKPDPFLYKTAGLVKNSILHLFSRGIQVTSLVFQYTQCYFGKTKLSQKTQTVKIIKCSETFCQTNKMDKKTT